MFNIKINFKQAVLFLSGALVFLFYFFIVLPLNIHGDAKFHTLYAKESVERENLVKKQPYAIYQFEGDERIYSPIAYPLTSESLFTVMYLFGGEIALKLYSPLCATIIFFLIMICLKEIGYYKASFIAILSTLSMGERLIMTPLMEPFMIVLLLAGLFTLKKYFFTDKSSFLVAAGVFYGAAASVKQQGIIILAFVVTFLFCYFIYKVLVKKYNLSRGLFLFSIFLLVAFSTPFLAISDQVARTGTFAYAPGKTDLPNFLPFRKYFQPLLISKYETNSEALKAKDQVIGYNKVKLNFIDKLNGFLLSPFLFYRSTNKIYYDESMLGLLKFVGLLTLLAFFVKVAFEKANRTFWFLLIGLAGVEVVTSYGIKTPITQYHSFGIVLFTLLIFYSAFKLGDISRRLGYLAVSFLFIFFLLGYFEFIFPLWSNSGREDSYHLTGYKRIGNFVRKNTSQDAIFFAAETSFRYYAMRDIVWLNEGIGDSIFKVSTSKNDTQAIEELKKLKVDYLVINKEQMERYGVNDYLPADGLVSFIDKSNYFKKVYDPYMDNEMLVYQVKYP